MASKVRTEAAILASFTAFPPVPMPVNVKDKAQFPEIAEALRYLASKRAGK